MRSHQYRLSSSQNFSGSKGRSLALVAALSMFSSVFLSSPILAAGLLYNVNTTSDAVVIGACANGLASCSLRGAISAANTHAGDDGIEFSLPTGSVINLTSALPDVSTNIDIAGPGADKLTVRRNTGGDYSVFKVTTGATVYFSGLTISNGSGLGNGAGGIQNSIGATVNVINCTLSGNRAVGGPGGSGGAIQNRGTLNVINSTLSGNSSAASGGAIFNSGIINVTNSTLAGNTASIYGGAIYNGDTANVTASVTNSTLSGNSAFSGGGGIYNEGSVSVKSSIIALNTTALTNSKDVFGAFTSQGYNLIGKKDLSTGFTNVTDQTGTVALPLNPQLDPAGALNNGGPTPTIALLVGSPAIDKGRNFATDTVGNPILTDQRGAGFPRTFNDPSITNAVGADGTDIGAFELQTAVPPVTLDIDDSRTATKYDALTDGLLVIRYLFGLTNASLTGGALGSTAMRTDPTVIKTYLDANRLAFDIDGNGNADALTDGLLIIRYLFGLRGAVLIQGAVAPGAPRNTVIEIESALATLTP